LSSCLIKRQVIQIERAGGIAQHSVNLGARRRRFLSATLRQLHFWL